MIHVSMSNGHELHLSDGMAAMRWQECGWAMSNRLSHSRAVCAQLPMPRKHPRQSQHRSCSQLPQAAGGQEQITQERGAT